MDERYSPPGADVGPQRAENATKPSAVFDYFVEPGGTRSSAIGIYVLISPLLVAMLFGLVGLSEYALPAGALTAAGMWWHRRRAKTLPRAKLFIEGSRLRVVDRSSRELVNVLLSDLSEVELDTKTIQRVQESMSAGVPELRFLNSKVGSATDVARIVLITRELDVPLTAEQHSHSYAIEAFGQIRRFLRQHGWLPQGERSAG